MIHLIFCICIFVFVLWKYAWIHWCIMRLVLDEPCSLSSCDTLCYKCIALLLITVVIVIIINSSLLSYDQRSMIIYYHHYHYLYHHYPPLQLHWHCINIIIMYTTILYHRYHHLYKHHHHHLYHHHPPSQLHRHCIDKRLSWCSISFRGNKKKFVASAIPFLIIISSLKSLVISRWQMCDFLWWSCQQRHFDGK